MSLNFITKFGYGVGHVLNDLCSSVWFTYALVYYTVVIGLPSIDAGRLLLIGQIADGLATPLVGYLSDRFVVNRWLYEHYGKRKLWHIFGTIGILISMPFMFTPCLSCPPNNKIIKIVYYGFFIIVFQVCWATVQISHLSLVPDLTLDSNERTQLLSLRTTFAVLSNIAVYSVAWGVLAVDSPDSSISAKDAKEFQVIVYTIVAAGALMSVIFHACVKETSTTHQLLDDIVERKPILSILKELPLYQVAIVYMCARLFGNMIQVLIPFYVKGIMTIGASSIAVVPFVMYISSFLTSLFSGRMNQRWGRKISFSYASVVGGLGIVAVYFGKGEIYAVYIIYLTAVLLGSCQSAYLITSLAAIDDFIGHDVGNEAFVYGLMSFTDKLSSGAAIIIIQAVNPNQTLYIYQWSIIISCGISIVLGTATILTFKSTNREIPQESSESTVEA